MAVNVLTNYLTAVNGIFNRKKFPIEELLDILMLIKILVWCYYIFNSSVTLDGFIFLTEKTSLVPEISLTIFN